jgi:hypothetical protein
MADRAARVSESLCANCRAPLAGAYCSACGQAARSPLVSLREFVSHALHEFSSLDTRLTRTLRALLLRPGHLTREYVDGRRVRFTQPLQLYLLAAAAFFLVASYRPFVWIDIARLQVVGRLPGLTVGNEVVRERLLQLPPDPAAHEIFALRFVGAVQGYLPVFLIASVLLFSLAEYLVNHRHERRFLPHAVFALHWTAFFLLLLAAARLLPAAWQVEIFTLVVGLVYLVVGLRRVYGQRLLASVPRALVLLLAFLLILAAWVQSAFVVGLAAV